MARRMGLAAALALALALAGCATDVTPASLGPSGAGQPASQAGALPSAAGAGGLPDACDLLTAAEVAAIVGNPVDDGTSLASAECSWGSDPDDTSAALLFTATGTTAICTGALEADDNQIPVDDFEHPAFWLWSAPAGGVGTLSICADGLMILATVSGGLDDASDEALVMGKAAGLAQFVMDRI